MPRIISTIPKTIPNGQALTAEIDLGKMILLAIGLPAAWTAADLTFFSAPNSGGTFQEVYDDTGAKVVVVAAASRVVTIGTQLKHLLGYRFIKVRSSTSGTGANAVNQGADRVLTLFLEDVI